MTRTIEQPTRPREAVLLGDEAVAFGALDAGISAAYAYPGTPSTEIQETLIKLSGPDVTASWCVNEKTAFEQALGTSMAGRRVMVTMKHVGLNVAADPFMNSALVDIQGGLVVAVADDPGMHSSQNEQDSRFYAEFAHVPCLEPSDQQEAYEMTRAAFEISERFHVPVMIRLVTHLAHSRARVVSREPALQNPVHKADDPQAWILLPAIARKRWRSLLDRQDAMRQVSEESEFTRLEGPEGSAPMGVITCGLGRNYFLENAADLPEPVPHLHIGAYPLPTDAIRKLAARCDSLLIIEEGYPLLERKLRGILDAPIEIRGRTTGAIPLDGELTPDIVRAGLGLPTPESRVLPDLELPIRPPQLCQGCPHGDAYISLKEVLSKYETSLVTADIGCYTLGALPPYGAIESCVCMGASVGMAKGAAEAGLYPVVAVIGDSTFLHSGVNPLIDAVAADANMTLLILDNEVVAMTGGQPTQRRATDLHQITLGTGVPAEHCHMIQTHPSRSHELTELLAKEVEHQGLSVIIAVRDCIEAARKEKKEKRRKEGKQ